MAETSKPGVDYFYGVKPGDALTVRVFRDGSVSVESPGGMAVFPSGNVLLHKMED